MKYEFQSEITNSVRVNVAQLGFVFKNEGKLETKNRKVNGESQTRNNFANGCWRK